MFLLLFLSRSIIHLSSISCLSPLPPPFLSRFPPDTSMPLHLLRSLPRRWRFYEKDVESVCTSPPPLVTGHFQNSRRLIGRFICETLNATHALISAAILLPEFNKLHGGGSLRRRYFFGRPVTMFIIHETIVTCTVTTQSYCMRVTMCCDENRRFNANIFLRRLLKLGRLSIPCESCKLIFRRNFNALTFCFHILVLSDSFFFQFDSIIVMHSLLQPCYSRAKILFDALF